jgi:beta-ureidopropionase / N-carbamoyl-L-amino-acid hydrolase
MAATGSQEPAPSHNLSISAERLWDNLMDTAKIGGTPKGGLCRLTLTEEDREAREWLRKQTGALGCEMSVDDMGTMYARRRGQRNDVPPIAIGSHLDSQPTGGKFDGALGVLAALEVLHTLHIANYKTFAPVELVNWTNEEGSRFAPALTASGVFARVFERDWAHGRDDRSGIRFGDALEAIGYRGTDRCGARKFSAHFELHIEQGPVLEREAKDIGVVTGVQGTRWFECTLTGAEAHTGSTPMQGRKNALIGAARVVEAVDAIARAHPPLAVATVGLLEVKPNSRNVIPGETFFTVDMRHPRSDVLDAMEQKLGATVADTASFLGLTAMLRKIWDQPPVVFDADCISCVRRAAASCGYSARDMVSGAQHDSAYVARVAPTSMIFVPCRDGISHNEAEFTSKEQCARGAQVLLQAVLEFDRLLAKRHAHA